MHLRLFGGGEKEQHSKCNTDSRNEEEEKIEDGEFKLTAGLLFQFMEWDAQNVILTGSSDGVVRVSCSFFFVYTCIKRQPSAV